MSDPIPAADELSDTTTMRRIRRRRDALPDTVTAAACLVVAACVAVASMQSATAGLGVALLAVLACLALWALTSERGQAAWRGLFPPLVAAGHWLRRATGEHGRHRRHGWSCHPRQSRARHRGGYLSTRVITPSSAPRVPGGPASHAVHSR